jgi:hypothetical protein
MINLLKNIFLQRVQVGTGTICRHSVSEMDKALGKVVNKAETQADIRLNLDGIHFY